jgi:hypothetical protein
VQSEELSGKKMTEQTPDTRKSKRKKHVVLLVMGIIMTMIAQRFKMHNPSTDMLGFGERIAYILFQPPVSYFVVLSIVALISSAISRNIRKFWFPVLAWLFLAAGIFDIVVGGFNEFVLLPRINQNIEELVRSGKLKVPEFDPRERILGHWSSEDNLTHQYFDPNNHLIIINLGQRKDVKYSIEDFSVIERWIKFNVSGADYEPHTRTVYFLGDGTALVVSESSLGKLQTKLKHMGAEQSP